MASPIRFAGEPPPVRLPEKPLQPIASASHPTTVCSIVTAAGEERQAVTFWFRTLVKRSAMAATGSPEPSTYPKKRGLGGREWLRTSPRLENTAGPIPCSGKGPSKIFSEVVPEVEGKVGRESRVCRNSVATSMTWCASRRNSSGARSRGVMGKRYCTQRNTDGCEPSRCGAFRNDKKN